MEEALRFMQCVLLPLPLLISPLSDCLSILEGTESDKLLDMTCKKKDKGGIIVKEPLFRHNSRESLISKVYISFSPTFTYTPGFRGCAATMNGNKLVKEKEMIITPT